MTEREALMAELLREGMDIADCGGPYPWTSEWKARVKAVLAASENASTPDDSGKPE